MSLSEHLRSSAVLLRGKRFSIVRTRGKHPREVIVHPGAVVILPLLDDRNVAMIRNQRVAVGRTLWELPAGTLEPGEPPRSCAARELIEETGYRAAKLKKLCEFYTSPGICTEVMYCFLASGLKHVGQELDAGETITVEAVPLKQTIQMVRRNDIRDGKSIATLLFYWALVRG